MKLLFFFAVLAYVATRYFQDAKTRKPYRRR